MLHRDRRFRVLCLCALLVAIPQLTLAQEPPRPSSLKLPTTIFAGAVLADWATTYHALKNYHVREQNPLLRPMDHQPGKMITVGAAMDAGLATAWAFTMGR